MTDADKTQSGETQTRVIAELTIAAPADAVWDALRDPAAIRNWFGWEADTLKDEVEFIFVTYGRESAEGETRILTFEGTPDRFEVIPAGDGAILRVVRAAPAGEDWEAVYEEMTEGWICFVQQLRLALERHGLKARRTIYFNGAAKPGAGKLIDALGLRTPGAALPGGARAGAFWHETPWQTGAAVPGWGDGLLVAVDRAPPEDGGPATAWMVATAYGLSDAEFAALEGAWTAWWAERFDAAGPVSC